MEIFDAVAIGLLCRRCGESYEVPLQAILMSHNLLEHEGRSIAVLHNDHLKGRTFITDLNNAYASDAQPDNHSLIVALRKLIDFCSGNIWKEDYLLFPLATKAFSSTDERIEISVGPYVHDRFERFVAEFDLATSGRREPCPVCVAH